MSKKKIVKDWGRTLVEVVLFIFTLIEYGSQGRDWLKVQLKGEWGIGFFEGLVVVIFFYYLLKTYGSVINEILIGLRELGRQSKDLRDKKTILKKYVELTSDYKIGNKYRT